MVTCSALTVEEFTQPSVTLAVIAAPEIAGYLVHEIIGRGGMGTVWRAERRQAEISQVVALKCLRADSITPELVQSFQRERRILAQLNHPGIATLIDAGQTSSGLPYLAMEYVSGVTLDQWCNNERLNPAARLALFIKVLAAVAYAHRNLIVHRDLKPNNILVDSEGHPKLLDFGIAKLLEPETGFASHTRSTRVYTVGYASPEQMAGKHITPASDVFSLGALLIELLFGVLPDPSSAQDGDTWMVLRNLMRTTVSGDKDTAPQRGVARAELRKMVRGDLAAILVKAYAAQPSERYASASEMLTDLRLHASGQSVIYARTSALSRTRKFLLRHRFVVALSGLAVVALLLLTLVAASAAVRLKAERDRAERERAAGLAVNDYLLDVFRAASPNVALGKVATAEDLLKRGRERFSEMSTQAPLVRARLGMALAQIHFYTGQWPEAEGLIQAARTALELAPEVQPVERLEAMRLHGDVLLRLGRHGESIAMLESAVRASELPELERTHELDDKRAELWANLGLMQNSAGFPSAALINLDRAVLWYEANAQTQDSSYSAALHNRASTQTQLGAFSLAAQDVARALAVKRQLLGAEHPSMLISLQQYGEIQSRLGQRTEALKTLQGVLDGRLRVLGASHPHVAQSYQDLAARQRELGDLTAAQRQLERAQSAHLALPKGSLPASWHDQWGLLLAARGDYVGAAEYVQKALQLRLAQLPPDSLRIARNRLMLAQLLQRTGDLRSAARLRAQARGPMVRELGEAAFARADLLELPR